MSDRQAQTGYFIFSLDTEMAWGFFDVDARRAKLFSSNGATERRSINRLLEILDEFGIVGTWAIVGHLFYERCEECDVCPVLEWEGRYRSFHEVYKTDAPLWYGADIVERLLSSESRHEIAFHGYTHEIFDESLMTADQARIEIREWLRVSERMGIVPRTVVFPRDRVGHLDVFREFGFTCYRGDEKLPRLHRIPWFGTLAKSLDHVLSLSKVPLYDIEELRITTSGLVEHDPSQHLFGFNRRLEMMLDSVNLHNLRINRMITGVRNAAQGNLITHLWAHPWEFRTEKDFDKLRYLFDCVAKEMGRGKIQSIGMADLTRIAMRRHDDGVLSSA